ncbi:MAG: prolyl oligopeptidase family serine peptidase [Candidatus Hydrogenedentes bacterium]|nr:prolyl oligopeptidase family serine peptidase [Candidatus Hydrogenedentota bacterium]
MILHLLPLLLATQGAGEIAFEQVDFTSTHDQTVQSTRFYASPEAGPQPLLVVLHWWSAGMDTYNPDEWVVAARAHGWHVAAPHFRGPNKSPEACASPAARQDVLDATSAIQARAEVDDERIYLAGLSGGGHMSMVMAAYHPEAFSAVSAWAGISDLAAWHAETKAAGHHYWQDVEACVGGAPGGSPEVDAELRARSPLPHLGNAVTVPLDLATGILDGHTGSVPVRHTIDAFNAVARALGAPEVSQSRINMLSQGWAAPADRVADPDYRRDVLFRAEAGLARVTIFQGGHEGLPDAACAWLGQHRRARE